MSLQLLYFVHLGAAVSVMAMTISKAGIFRPLRMFAQSKSKWLGKLLGCPFCTSVWISFPVTAWYPIEIIPRTHFIIDWFITSMVMVFVASMCSGLILRAFAPDGYEED
ncbi:TPA: hypothetical protein DCW61_02100 [Candidatus Uhrbacteria bacterium]|nr:hypothetical protein [Candidatus Uhrbacteria bacterium]